MAWARRRLCEGLDLKPQGGPEHGSARLVSHLDGDLAADGSGQLILCDTRESPGGFIPDCLDPVELKTLVIRDEGVTVPVIEIVARHSLRPNAWLLMHAAGRRLRIGASLLLGEEAVTAPEKDDKKAALLARA